MYSLLLDCWIEIGINKERAPIKINCPNRQIECEIERNQSDTEIIVKTWLDPGMEQDVCSTQDSFKVPLLSPESICFVY